MKNRTYFPRTQEEAFGPGHRGPIHSGPEPLHPNDKIVMIGCAIVLVLAVLSYAWLVAHGGTP